MISALDAFAKQISANNPNAESVSYTPTGSTAVSRYAIVNRTAGMIKRSRIDDRPKFGAEMIISRDADDGIETVTPMKDKVVIAAPDLGETAHTYTVKAIIGHTAMCWHLGLQQ